MPIDRDLAGMAILEKSGAVIAALENIDELSAQTLAEQVGEPVSSTYRLLSSLVGIGWVEVGSRRGLYRLGVRFVRVGSLLEDRLSVRDACKPAMEHLRSTTGSSVFLCFRRADSAVCVERLDGRDVHSLAMRLGDSLPLYRGAASLALLSHLPDSEREAVLAHFDEHRGRNTAVPSDADIRKRIADVRRLGYAVSDEEITPGIAAVAAPVSNHRGELEGAISVSGLRHQIVADAAAIPALVLTAAAAASRALGAHGPGVP